MHKSIYLKNLDKKNLDKIAKEKPDSILIDFQNLSEIEKLSDTEIYVIIPVFQSAELLKKYPDAKPVESTRKDTYNFICPTHEGVREEVLKKVREALKHKIDGIWLNSLHYPTKWDQPEPDLLDTCYCKRCLELFQKYIGEPIEGVGGKGTELENIALHIDGSYYHEWLQFKSNQITSIAKEVKELIGDKKLGIFVVPWEDKDYGAGITRLLAQDFIELAQIADTLSPMLYYKELGKDLDWVKQKVDYFWSTGAKFLPIIKSQEAAHNASKPPSEGSIDGHQYIF